jgi:hypothetical protein
MLNSTPTRHGNHGLVMVIMYLIQVISLCCSTVEPLLLAWIWISRHIPGLDLCGCEYGCSKLSQISYPWQSLISQK